MADGICSIDGCIGKATRRGWCGKHYKRWSVHGDATRETWYDRSLDERFWQLVERRGDDECWPCRTIKATGYGSFRVGKCKVPAHRFAWELLVGPIPAGLVPDHRCHNDDPTCHLGNDCPHRACCNPAHLELVTSGENVRRGNVHRTQS